MMMLPTATLLVLLAFFTSLNSAAPMESLWALHDCPAVGSGVLEAAAPLNVTVYVRMAAEATQQDDAAIVAQLGERLGGHAALDSSDVPLAARIGALREIFAPEPGHTAAVERWLHATPALRAHCERRSIFVYACTNIPAVSVARDLLHVRGAAETALCRYRPTQVPASLQARAPELVLRVHPAHFETVARVNGVTDAIAHVEGLLLHDYTQLPKRRNQHQAVANPSPASSLNLGASHSTATWPLNQEPVVLNFGLGVDNVPTVLIALACSDGSYPTFGDVCSSNPITVFSVSVYVSGGASMLINVPIADAQCSSAFDFLATGSNIGTHTVCQVPLGGVSGYFNGHDVASIKILLMYQNGAASQQVGMCPWYDGAFDGLGGNPSSSYCHTSTGIYSYPKPFMISDIQHLYSWNRSSNASTSAIPVVGIMEWTNGWDTNVFDVDDLTSYLEANNISSFNVATQLNLSYYQTPTTQMETTLDVDLVAGLVPEANIYLLSVFFDPFVSTPLGEWLYLLEMFSVDPANYGGINVFSVSWTFGDPSVQQSVCDSITAQFRILSIAGITVVAASGDTGAGTNPGSAAVLQFPDASPYCVSAGATALVQYPAGGLQKEVVCSAGDGNIITSGGGYSTHYAQPEYQSPILGTGNQGRGAPDLSALGANIGIIINGNETNVYGTSASTPIIAAMIARLNAARLSRGLSTMALFHYFIYNRTLSSDIFTDVTSGTNCYGESQSFPWMYLPAYATCYSAAVGWDAVSGLGTPKYPQLETAALRWSASLVPPAAGTLSEGSSTSGDGTSCFIFCGLTATSKHGIIAAIVIACVCSVSLIGFRMARRRNRLMSSNAAFGGAVQPQYAAALNTA